MESTSARGSGPFHLTEPRAVRASVADARLSHCFLSTPPRRTGNVASTEASVVLASRWSKWRPTGDSGPIWLPHSVACWTPSAQRTGSARQLCDDAVLHVWHIFGHSDYIHCSPGESPWQRSSRGFELHGQN